MEKKLADYDFEKYAAMSDEEVLIALDAAVFAATFAAEEPDKETKLRRIVEWFSKEEEKLRDTICNDERVQKVHAVASKDGAELLAAVADALVLAFGGPTAALISVTICRRGLATYCISVWEQNS